VAVHEGGEGGLIPAADEAVEELTVAGVAVRLGAEEMAELP
jgi:hypothetical protein